MRRHPGEWTDYAHHPTELVTTLAGLRAFYPGRRIVVDFMSHTYSRTAALLGDFATAFSAADEVLLHPVYASARERSALTPEQAGRALYDAVAGCHERVRWCATLAEGRRPSRRHPAPRRPAGDHGRRRQLADRTARAAHALAGADRHEASG